MDVFSLLKFWRNAGIGHPNTTDFDTTDDEGSFFDLVFTNNDSPQVNIITTHTYYSSPHTVVSNNNNNISTKTTTPRSPFRVLMLGFHNTKSKSKEMKCEIEEVTISSLLKRDHSFGDHDQMPSKRFSKDVVNRYLNLIKPLVSRRSNQHSSLYTCPKKEEKPSVFKEVRKHLGKSRSSSSFVKPSPSPVAKRDDSAFQQQDGIQSAILHCKKSYNSPSQGCSVLSRSGSAPSQGSRISVEEEKRSSI